MLTQSKRNELIDMFRIKGPLLYLSKDDVTDNINNPQQSLKKLINGNANSSSSLYKDGKHYELFLTFLTIVNPIYLNLILH